MRDTLIIERSVKYQLSFIIRHELQCQQHRAVGATFHGGNSRAFKPHSFIFVPWKGISRQFSIRGCTAYGGKVESQRSTLPVFASRVLIQVLCCPSTRTTAFILSLFLDDLVMQGGL